MSYDEATLQYYEAAAPRYTASSAEYHHRHLDPFLDLLEPGALVLELGCGCGLDASRMLKRGFQVDATDGTKAMVKKAKERFGIDARVMRFDELDAVLKYDAVWAHASLLHAPRNALPDALARILKSLKAGGLHFANYKLGDERHPDEGRDPLGRWTSLPTQEWLIDQYAAIGFELLSNDRYTGDGSDGVVRDWASLIVRKA